MIEIRRFNLINIGAENMNNENTIIAMHIVRINEDGSLKLNPKHYYWHIPKKLRGAIEKGDIVLVDSKDNQAKVLVINVYREELEATGKRYKRVKQVLDKVNKIKEETVEVVSSTL